MEYNKDANNVDFSQEQLLAITPDDLRRWMCVRAFGVPEPGPEDRPTHAQSISLENAKKAISFFMPRKQPWDDPTTMVGNPTKSIAVNSLLREIRKHEVRGEGVPSRAKRSLTKAEFEQVLDLLNSFDDIYQKYMIPAACKFQFVMIGCEDNICHFKEVDLNVNPLLPSCSLVSCICWSKNVMEERHSPRRMIFGSMDTRYCVLLSLGIYLEVWSEVGDGLESPYLFGRVNDPDRNKAYIANI